MDITHFALLWGFRFHDILNEELHTAKCEYIGNVDPKARLSSGTEGPHVQEGNKKYLLLSIKSVLLTWTVCTNVNSSITLGLHTACICVKKEVRGKSYFPGVGLDCLGNQISNCVPCDSDSWYRSSLQINWKTYLCSISKIVSLWFQE